ncbi:hypothetical protein RHGRI_037549 [Rhododendron griersonianum]|uniref:Terpene synthase N-terminal domain-containing protein n=1 Tax=Rhododendron griersonianum TaxID=479676 RepID=A0AAV6HXK5_9ERIC|nr:hypothetical protein RHGRI_037549 [Rhododendron griersonianum]
MESSLSRIQALITQIKQDIFSSPFDPLSFVSPSAYEKVPTTYPFDGELIRLCLVNHIQRLGLAEHFTKEIDEVLENIYRSYKNQESREIDLHLAPAKIYKDSLAFRLLQMHGYNVTPRSFCWFLYDEDIRVHVERNFEYVIGALYNVYRATELMFSREYEAEEARLFSKKLLEKSLKLKSVKDDPNFQRVVRYSDLFNISKARNIYSNCFYKM